MDDRKNSKPTKEEMEEENKVERVDEKKYFEKVLDDVVNLNSLFSFAVFIGLSLAQPGQVLSLEDEKNCYPDTSISKRLVAFEIASFSCFIFSGFLANTVKVYLYTPKKHDGNDGSSTKNSPSQRKSLVGFYMSIYGTFFGCLLLLLAMVDVIQIKLGRLSCNSGFTVSTVSFMVGTVGLSLLIYFIVVTYGLWFTYWKAKASHPAA